MKVVNRVAVKGLENLECLASKSGIKFETLKKFAQKKEKGFILEAGMELPGGKFKYLASLPKKSYFEINRDALRPPKKQRPLVIKSKGQYILLKKGKLYSNIIMYNEHVAVMKICAYPMIIPYVDKILKTEFYKEYIWTEYVQKGGRFGDREKNKKWMEGYQMILPSETKIKKLNQQEEKKERGERTMRENFRKEWRIEKDIRGVDWNVTPIAEIRDGWAVKPNGAPPVVLDSRKGAEEYLVYTKERLEAKKESLRRSRERIKRKKDLVKNVNKVKQDLLEILTLGEEFQVVVSKTRTTRRERRHGAGMYIYTYQIPELFDLIETTIREANSFNRVDEQYFVEASTFTMKKWEVEARKLIEAFDFMIDNWE